MSMPCVFAQNPQGTEEEFVVLRPQTPRPPLPYQVRELKFWNIQDSIELAGTLTLPLGTGPFPAVVLISGSGPHNRDAEAFNHKPFAVIADYFSRRGIAVFRYDERGTGGSGGIFQQTTSRDFSRDAEAAMEFIRRQADIDPGKTGVIGHEEGGIIASMISARNPNVAFLVLLAAPGIPLDQFLLRQAEMQGNVPGGERIDTQLAFFKKAYAVLKQEKDAAVQKARILQLSKEFYVGENSDYPEGPRAAEKQAEIMTQVLLNPWFREFIGIEPEEYLKKTSCPVLALNGSKDVQTEAGLNLDAIRNALEKGGNRNFRIQEMKGLNHMFQKAGTGASEEYAEIRQTFSEEVLQNMRDWILELK